MPSGVVEVNVGASLTIVCEAHGIPQPIITWRQQGRGRSDELDNTRTFRVDVKDRFMAGPIECIATNGVGEATAGIQLVVLCKLLECSLHSTTFLKKMCAFLL